LPTAEPAKKPTSGVNAYSNPRTAKLVDAGAAAADDGTASVATVASATARKRRGRVMDPPG
jgi:hypothetical protein